jgi:spore germination protein GerM
VWVAFAVLIAAAAGFLFWPRRDVQAPAANSISADPSRTDDWSVTLYFGAADARTLVPESRGVAAASAFEARVEAVIQAWIAGPDADRAVRTVPVETRLQKVFWDEDTATVYLDFTPALVTRHPGGSTAEYATLGSLVRTLDANFSEVARVQILVDGEPVETLAGHYDTSKPIEIESWR